MSSLIVGFVSPVHAAGMLYVKFQYSDSLVTASAQHIPPTTLLLNGSNQLTRLASPTTQPTIPNLRPQIHMPLNTHPRPLHIPPTPHIPRPKTQRIRTDEKTDSTRAVPPRDTSTATCPPQPRRPAPLAPDTASRTPRSRPRTATARRPGRTAPGSRRARRRPSRRGSSRRARGAGISDADVAARGVLRGREDGGVGPVRLVRESVEGGEGVGGREGEDVRAQHGDRWGELVVASMRDSFGGWRVRRRGLPDGGPGPQARDGHVARQCRGRRCDPTGRPCF